MPRMSTIEVGCDLAYQVRQSTVFLFQIAAARTEHQLLTLDQLTFEPAMMAETCHVGPDGNQLHRVVVDPGELKVSYRATAELSPFIEQTTDVSEWTASQMPADVLTYLNPSRYCESDLLGKFAFEEFGELNQGFSRVQTICDWVNHQLEYSPGSTTGTTTAADVLLLRTGVCRDYAHLAITLCRGLGIPARYVAGYAVDLQPPDFHGFMEAFLDGQWYLFDPTGLAPVSGLVRIGVGRDAADVSFATITGDASLTNKQVWANSNQLENPNAAVSTA